MRRRQRELPEVDSVPPGELVGRKVFCDVGKRFLYEAQLHDPIGVECLGMPEQLDALSKANRSVVEVFRDHPVKGVDFVSSTFVFSRDRHV